MNDTITRTDQALAVLRAGGRGEQRDNLWVLYDASGKQLPAWQNAVAAAARIQENKRK